MLHLNYDGKQENGIIFNDSYTGALYTGKELKPTLSISYDSFFYSEVFEGANYIEVNNIKTVMDPSLEAEIKGIASLWEQPLGQEGNPDLEQKKVIKQSELLTVHSSITKAMVGNITNEEMATWTTQEAEARAWKLDNTVVTPLVDGLLLGRAYTGETKAILADKIIANAEAYQSAYAPVLGNLQAKTKAISEALTDEEIDAIVW